MAATAILEISKNCYLTNGLTDLHEINFGKMMQNGSPPRPLKILNFKNSIWRKAAILKTVKSQYLRNHSAVFDKICTMKHVGLLQLSSH